MITFWIFAIAMVIIALIFTLRPLLIDLHKNDADRAAQNVAITKERLNELKVELEQETITKDEYEQTKEELEQALLNDVEESSVKLNSESNKSIARFTRYVLIITVPVLAAGFYTYLGQPELIEGVNKQAAAPAGHDSSNKVGRLGTVEEMVEKLAAKLKENPNNAEGWFMLARSYMSMNRYKEAVEALEKTNQLIPDNPTVMLRYADALTMLSGGRIGGKPFDLIKRAVAIKPDDVTGLWLIGMGYEEQGEYQKAISYWNLLVPLLKDNKSIDEVNNLIRSAKSKAGISITDNSTQPVVKTEKKAATSVKVKVILDQNMKKNVSMDDIVFIFAKAISGPPMPLAVVRKQVKDLPLEVILDDSMAMIPTMKLSSFEKVNIIARVSKSGSPKSQSGDLQSKTVVVRPGQKEQVKLIINNVLP